MARPKPPGYESNLPALIHSRTHSPRIAVLSGGGSAESAASRVSATGVHETLAAAGYEVAWLDLSDQGRWSLISAHPENQSVPDISDSTNSWTETLTSLLRVLRIDLIFPVLHGALGEDGQIQKLCEFLSLQYVGCGPDASLTCYDKTLFKDAMLDAGLPIPAYLSVQLPAYEDDPAALASLVGQRLGYPCIVKPAKAGSSIGLSRVATSGSLSVAVARAFRFDDVVLVEEFTAGCDVEIGLLGDTSPVIGSPVEIEYEGELYDFAAKYGGRRDHTHLPARFPTPLVGHLTELARKAFEATGCRGMARVDFLVDRSSEQAVVNEINTIPYMPATSSFAVSLCDATGYTYSRLVASLVELAWDAKCA
ncbi:MAG: D-alanine--D-alanine ligase [Solirubrobacteraceae bacterium]